MNPDHIALGDPIEVRFLQEGTPITEVWIQATVCSLSTEQIGAALSDGTRGMVERISKNWRPYP
jgi:hypothetical protein